MRALFTIVLCPVLLLTLQQAPLLHVHEKGHATEHVTTEHSHGRGAHFHLDPRSKRSSEDRSEIAAPNDNESAVAISFFHSENPKAPTQYVIVRACPFIDTLTPFVVRAPQELPRFHDPPFFVSLIPRAPPV